MSRFLLPFFSPILFFFLSSFSPSVIHYISKQHQNSHRPFSSEISKRNVIACKASTFLPSTFLLWEVYLSWLFLVSDSFFSLFFSFPLLCINHSLTHSLTHCLTVLIMDTYLYDSRPNPRHLSRYRRRNLRTRLCSDIGCSWLDLSLFLSLPLSLSIPLPSIFSNHPPPQKKRKKEKRKKLTQFNPSSFFFVYNRNRMRNNPTC